MFLIFGTGDVGQGLAQLLTILDFPHTILDDATWSDELLDQAEKVIVSPGVPPHHKLRKTYPDKIMSELNFLGRLLPRYDRWQNFEIIGITGTNGKSTTTRALYSAFKLLFEKECVRDDDEGRNRKKQEEMGRNRKGQETIQLCNHQTIQLPEVHITGNFKPSLSTTIAEIVNNEQRITNSEKGVSCHPELACPHTVGVEGSIRQGLSAINPNIKDVSTLQSDNHKTIASLNMTQSINPQTPKHLLIAECSSFMLYQLQTFHFDYSILTNISPDHLNRHVDMDDYARAKWEVVKATKTAAFVKKEAWQESIEKKPLSCREGLGVRVVPFGPDYDLTGTHFIGQHNAANLQSVYLLAKKYILDHNFSINDDQIRAAVAQVSPVPHRLAYMTTIDGIAVYDDGICTSSDAQEAALKSFLPSSQTPKNPTSEATKNQKIILICGGSDKGDHYDHLDDLYKKTVGYAICMGTMMAPRFLEQFQHLRIPCVQTVTMAETIQQAFLQAKKHNLTTILFSPGCASFDIFKNVYDRIGQFEEEIKKISDWYANHHAWYQR